MSDGGKGDKRRKEDTKKFSNGWDAIDWNLKAEGDKITEKFKELLDEFDKEYPPEVTKEPPASV